MRLPQANCTSGLKASWITCLALVGALLETAPLSDAIVPTNPATGGGWLLHGDVTSFASAWFFCPLATGVDDVCVEPVVSAWDLHIRNHPQSVYV